MRVYFNLIKEGRERGLSELDAIEYALIMRYPELHTKFAMYRLELEEKEAEDAIRNRRFGRIVLFFVKLFRPRHRDS